ncbi:MAG: hypothetical protein ACE5E6_07400 [Phycisphaerae bacterium]
MESIVSGPTTERVVRTAIMTGVVMVAAGWFIKDGVYSWPQQNLEGAVKALVRDKVIAAAPSPPPAIHRGLTSRRAGEIGEGDAWAAVRERLGAPGLTAGKAVYYFGPGGVLRLVVDGDTVIESTWRDASKDHDETALAMQLVLGGVLGMLGIGLLVQLLRIVTGRTTLSDDGLAVRGRPVIPFDAMTGINAEKYRKTGRLEVRYTRNGHPAGVRLDDYVIKEFRAIVTAICDRKGFDNPLPPPSGE